MEKKHHAPGKKIVCTLVKKAADTPELLAAIYVQLDTSVRKIEIPVVADSVQVSATRTIAEEPTIPVTTVGKVPKTVLEDYETKLTPAA